MKISKYKMLIGLVSFLILNSYKVYGYQLNKSRVDSEHSSSMILKVSRRDVDQCVTITTKEFLTCQAAPGVLENINPEMGMGRGRPIDGQEDEFYQVKVEPYVFNKNNESLESCLDSEKVLKSVALKYNFPHSSPFKNIHFVVEEDWMASFSVTENEPNCE